MTTRQELLDHWRDRFCEAEEACDDPRTDSWSARLRRKLYRFLLTMYGQADWPGPKDDVDNEVGRLKNSQLVVAEPQQALAGKEPRTRAQILKGLQNIKGLSEELAPPGPLGQGLHPNSPMAVASFKKRPRAETTFWRLKKLGFAPEMVFRGNQYQIFVIASLAPAAIRQLEENRIETQPVKPASRTVQYRQRYNVVLLLGAVLFAGLAVWCTGVGICQCWFPAKVFAEVYASPASGLSMLGVAACLYVFSGLLFGIYLSVVCVGRRVP